jgi:3-oxoacyl-(acyl-carrier-protein) synthase
VSGLPRVVVTGVAAVTALGRDLASTALGLAEGRSAVAPVYPAGQAPHGASPAARIASFTTEPELPKAKARRLDRGSLFAVVAARQCIGDAGWQMAGREERTGILLGTGSAGAGPLTEFERQMAVESPEAASPFLFPYTVANAPASVVALELVIKGPNVTVIQKDPAAFNALFYGRMMLADGRADALLIGAADEWSLTYHQAYEHLRVTRSDGREGFVLGEGAGVVLVEPEESARARGARTDVRLAGLATRPVPMSPHVRQANPSHLAAVIRAALEEAGTSPTDIGLVHLSRNGVPWVDDAEREALEEVFGGSLPRTSAVKLQIGENPFAGATQLALAAAALRTEVGLRAVLVNAFGAGGNFFSAVLSRE